MSEIFLMLLCFWFGLGVRTAGFWLQNWQIREYRFDRMRAHFFTTDGIKDLFNLWFFRGIFPRPRISGRIILIGLLFAVFSSVFVFAVEQNFNLGLLTIILWERTIFFWIWLSVFISDIPVFFVRQFLFYQACQIMKQNKNVEVIGITGSFGKSSTKAILIHLLQSKFGEEAVLYNPGNENNEVAIARLVLKNRGFFADAGAKNPSGSSSQLPLRKGAKRKFFVVEIGAYKMGEIRQVCNFVFPKIGILTGINTQHLSLFGSQERIQRAKFELAESAAQKVFFNANSPLLAQVFEDREIQAVKIPISFSAAKKLKKHPEKTEFEIYGKKMVLPWGGGFFVGNAFLAMEACREYGMKPEEIEKALKKLPPLERALSVQKHKKGFTVLTDLYSANPDGVLVAVDHLDQFSGKKIFVGIPLLELGENAESVHRQIFERLEKMDTEVFWWKPDFSNLGTDICGNQFHGKDLKKLKKQVKDLKSGDVVLLESKLPKDVTELF